MFPGGMFPKHRIQVATVRNTLKVAGSRPDLPTGGAKMHLAETMLTVGCSGTISKDPMLLETER